MLFILDASAKFFPHFRGSHWNRTVHDRGRQIGISCIGSGALTLGGKRATDSLNCLLQAEI